MADFDNGLPPDGTDITGNSVSSVNITDVDADNSIIANINSVNISKEITGSNWGTMM